MPNIRSTRPAETRDFFVDLLGFEVAMDMGWITTVVSPTNPSVQVSIISNDDMAAPGISVEVASCRTAPAERSADVTPLRSADSATGVDRATR